MLGRMSIGERIRQARERAGVSQNDLGQRIGVLGQTIWRYEDGRIEPRGAVAVALAEALGVTTQWLLTGAEDDPSGRGHGATRRAVEDFLASPLAKDVTPNQSEALRHINLNAVSPTIYTIYDIWRTAPWDIVEAQMVDGKVPSARGAKIPGRKGGNKPSR